MRNIITLICVLMPLPAIAETVTLKVDGLVCAYCVQGIEKKFRELGAVKDIGFDLDAGTVTLKTKAENDVSDAAIKDIISYGGYKLQSIERQP